MDISRQVFMRSARMGITYVVMSLVMGIALSILLNVAASVGGVVGNGGKVVDVGGILGSILVPVGALVGLVITTPVYLLFVSDKNSGVLEYLLAVGMDQRDIFMGYLKATVLLCLVALAPVVVINAIFLTGGAGQALLGIALTVVTGVSDVALVTVLMTAFSSMQRRPTGMNSPVGITIGVFFLIPELVLISVLGPQIVWLEGAVAAGLFVVAVVLVLYVGRLIAREKLLP